MASDSSYVEYIVEQIENIGEISYRYMFGGCTVYYKSKVVALICDNQLFVKPTKAGRSFIGDVAEAPPYPGAKPFFLIEDQVEDKDWIGQLIILTEKELPIPKPKKKR